MLKKGFSINYQILYLKTFHDFLAVHISVHILKIQNNK